MGGACFALDFGRPLVDPLKLGFGFFSAARPGDFSV